MRITLILLSLWAWNAANAEMTLLKPTATAPDGRARVALVVGIAGYPEVSSTNAFETLTHPLNDATDIATELQRYGFFVILLKDATKKEFEDAVNCFAKECEEDWKIRENSVALFYYSGHGLVVLDKGKKTNFVMPKRGFKDAADVKEYGFSTNWLLNKMNAAQIKLMFLDACRSEKSLLEKKGFSDEDAGFVRMDLDGFEEKGTKSAHGIVIGYASQEGKPAIGHKKQRNSFYTAGLLEMLQNQAHQPIDRLLKLTSDRVFNLSMNKQMPWDDRRLIGDFCFANCGGETVFIPPQQSIKPEKVIQPEPVKTYILQVRADVSGAEIIVDNQIIGKTPLDVELKEGSHEIIVKYNGRQAKQTIDLQASRDFKVEFGKQAPKVGETFKDCLDCPEMVALKGGTFKMGSDDEKPIHEVNIKPFAMGKFEVTLGEFKAFVKATNYSVKKKSGCRWDTGRFAENDQQPVQCVSWNDATKYAQWLSKEAGYQYRLPTEAEWEYAARANTSTKWSFGDDTNQLINYAWCGFNQLNNFNEETNDVGQKKPNGFGLYDMHGNVGEWTCSDKENYLKNKHSSCSDNNNANKSLRGGSWDHFNAGCRSDVRHDDAPDNRSDSVGFRVVSGIVKK